MATGLNLFTVKMATTAEWVNYMLLYVGSWLIPLLVLIIIKRSMSKYPIVATIFEKRGENIIYTNDMIGRFDRPIACYRLKKSKDTIPIMQYDWVLQCMYKPTNFFEKIANMLSGRIGHVTLFKYGSKQYKPVRVRLNTGEVREVLKPVVDRNGQPVYVSIYEPINPRKSLNKLDFEVIDWDDINHMTQELRAIAVRRAPLQTFLEKYGHWIAFALAVMALIIAGYYYKDIVTSAECNSMTPSPPPAPATQPNIPVIGDMIPGK